MQSSVGSISSARWSKSVLFIVPVLLYSPQSKYSWYLSLPSLCADIFHDLVQFQIAGASLFGIFLSKHEPATCLKLAASLMIWSLPVVVLYTCCVMGAQFRNVINPLIFFLHDIGCSYMLDEQVLCWSPGPCKMFTSLLWEFLWRIYPRYLKYR